MAMAPDQVPVSGWAMIEQEDPEIAAAIRAEEQRQRDKIELIASENYVSAAVMAAYATVLTNKYAEGTPGHRYYGGCEYVDVVERLAIDRAKQIFGSDHANVQPHSGAQANMSVYLDLLKPGDTVLGMNLAHGGHLTHGSPVNASGLLYNFVAYGVDRETERIDYEKLQQLAEEHKPKLITVGASAYPRFIDFERMRKIADSAGSLLLADIAHTAGLVAAGLHPTPVGHAQIVTTTTHKTLRGPRGGLILCDAEFAEGIDKAVFPGVQGGPLMHVIAAKAIAFKEVLQPSFKDYAKRIIENAQVLASELQKRGLRIVSGGTDNHLMLVDVSSVGLRGEDAEKALDVVGITCNKNPIPFDLRRAPSKWKGIRLGTPATTTRGFGPAEMEQIAEWIAVILKNINDTAIAGKVAAEVLAMTSKFDIPMCRC